MFSTIRPSRALELSATTTRYVGAFLRPIRRSRILSAIYSPFLATAVASSSACPDVGATDGRTIEAGSYRLSAIGYQLRKVGAGSPVRRFLGLSTGYRSRYQ